MEKTALFIWDWMIGLDDPDVYDMLGLVFKDAPRTVYRKDYGPTLEVHSVRPTAIKTDGYGYQNFLVVDLLQRRWGFVDPKEQARHDNGRGKMNFDKFEPDFIYRAGCTLFLNPKTKEVRWIARTRGTIADNDELDQWRKYLTGDQLTALNAFAPVVPASLGLAEATGGRETFAKLHLRAGD